MPHVSPDRDGAVAILTLTRPDARNAVNMQMMAEIRAALTEIEGDSTLRAAILTGQGSVFCAGMDLAGFVAGEHPGITDPDRFGGFAGATRTKPFIAAINGPALAGGFELVLACEMAVCVPNARFGLPEVQLGLIAAGGGAVRLPHRLPPAIAAEMLFTGDPISADRACALGLINHVVEPEDLLQTALKLAHRIAQASPQALRATMNVLTQGQSAHEHPGWAETDRQWPQVSAHPDATEGPDAFLQKRKPQYRAT